MATIARRTIVLDDVVETAEAIAGDVVAEEAVAVDREARWPEAGIRALQSAGLGGLTAPKTSGGMGLGLFALARVCEVLGRECGSTALCYGMHCVGTAVIAAKATSIQHEDYLDPISRGEHLTTLALSEPGTGSHFYLPETKLLDNASDSYIIRGTKSFVTNGGHADSYVLSTVAADPDAPPGEFSCVVVRDGTAGMVWGQPWQGLGMRGNESRTLDLRDVHVPRGDLLGNEGEQIWYIFNVVAPYFLAAMAGTYLGLAGAALDEARSHLSRRRYSHTGLSLSNHSVLQHRFGTLWAMLERTRQLVYHATQEADAGGQDWLPAICSAKAEVADCVVNVVNESMTLTGGTAYREGSRFSRLLRDARAAHVMSPTTDILRTWTGRALLGQPILGT